MVIDEVDYIEIYVPERDVRFVLRRGDRAAEGRTDNWGEVVTR